MFERMLRIVEKPARYAGGEWNAVRKDPRSVRTRIVLAFPDVYEIGMSYLGQKILYQVANGLPGVQAERVFAPWPDLEAALRSAGEPLRSLESQTPLGDFDIAAFSLLYELNDSNILTMLDLGGIPLRADEREERHPLILAGGPAAFNPEPLAGVFDAFFLGDGEEGFPEIIEAWSEARRGGRSRSAALSALAGIEGVYIPAFYEAFRPEDSPLLAVRPMGAAGTPRLIRKRVLAAFSRSPFPEKIVVPHIQAVFDRVAVEVARGCPQKCRFCQATSLYHPHRVKDPEEVIKTVLCSLDATGYEDASLFALSVGDYPHLELVVRSLMERLSSRRVSLSLSSLRPKRLSAGIAASITRVRKTGFTLVPEAGTERLRRVINKSIEDKDLWEAAENAFRLGWKLLKLYFMIGLPTETDDDVAAIPILVRELAARGRAILGAPPRIHLSLASFIPKPHTPFQWQAMADPETLRDKQNRVRAELRRERSVEIKVHDVRQSVLEAVFSRGDRRLGGVLEAAWRAGARFDSWNDHFHPDIWEAALSAQGVESLDYRRSLPLDAPLPWDHLATGIKKAFLRSESEKALREEPTPACDERSCAACGGCEAKVGRVPPSPQALEIQMETPAPLGSAASPPIRYAVFYAKEGTSRFLGHNDLIRALQRILRRAGVETVHSEGFHPKPAMSFGPALPLGTTGKEEIFEFKSARALDPALFLERVQAVSPAGLRFGRILALPPDMPSLLGRIAEMVYRLDLEDAEVRRAVDEKSITQAVQKPPQRGEAALQMILNCAASGPEFSWLKEANLVREGRALELRAAFNPQKIPRPQDLVREALGLDRAVYALCRERFVLKPSFPFPN